MSGDLIMAENYRVHERVGALEQKVHTLEHRAESMEWLKPEVTKHGTLISEMNANHRALEKSFSRLSSEVEELGERFDALIKLQETYRTDQMRELHAIQMAQLKTNTHLRTAVKVIALVGAMLGLASNWVAVMDRFGGQASSVIATQEQG